MGECFVRVDSDFPYHPKTLEFERLVNLPGAGGYVVFLWSWAASNRPTGDLTGLMPSHIAAAARWSGDPELFVHALKACGGAKPGFLEEKDGRLLLHDWRERQSYFAVAERRKRDRLRKRAQRWSQECPEVDAENSGTASPGCPTGERDTAGTMSHESPTLDEIRSDQRRTTSSPPTPPGGRGGFDAFWRAYPRKVGKKAALRAWNRLRPEPDLTQRILEAVDFQKQWPQWTKDGGQFIPHPATWLNQGRWEDEPPTPTSAPGPDAGRFRALMEDAQHASETD